MVPRCASRLTMGGDMSGWSSTCMAHTEHGNLRRDELVWPQAERTLRPPRVNLHCPRALPALGASLALVQAGRGAEDGTQELHGLGCVGPGEQDTGQVRAVLPQCADQLQRGRYVTQLTEAAQQ